MNNKAIKDIDYVHATNPDTTTSAQEIQRALNTEKKVVDLANKAWKDFPENMTLKTHGEALLLSSMKKLLGSSSNSLSRLKTNKDTIKIITQDNKFTGKVSIDRKEYDSSSVEVKLISLLLAYANLHKTVWNTSEERLKNILNDSTLEDSITQAQDNIELTDAPWATKIPSTNKENIDSVDEYKEVMEFTKSRFKDMLAWSLCKTLNINTKNKDIVNSFLMDNISDVQRENITMAYSMGMMDLLDKNMTSITDFLDKNTWDVKEFLALFQWILTWENLDASSMKKIKNNVKIPDAITTMFVTMQDVNTNIVETLTQSIKSKIWPDITPVKLKDYTGKDIWTIFADFDLTQGAVNALVLWDANISFQTSNKDTGPDDDDQKKFLNLRKTLSPKLETLRKKIPHIDAWEMLDNLTDEQLAQFTNAANILSDGEMNDIVGYFESTGLGKFFAKILSVLDMFMKPPLLWITYDELKIKVAVKSLIGSYNVEAKKSFDPEKNLKSWDKAWWKWISFDDNKVSDNKVPSSYIPYVQETKDPITGVDIKAKAIKVSNAQEFFTMVKKDINIETLSSLLLQKVAGNDLQTLKNILSIKDQGENADVVVRTYLNKNIISFLTSEKLKGENGKSCSRSNILTVIFEDILWKKKIREEKQKNIENTGQLDQISLRSVTKKDYDAGKIWFNSWIGTWLQYKVWDVWKSLDANTQIDMVKKDSKMQVITIKNQNNQEKDLIVYWTDWDTLLSTWWKKDSNDKYKIDNKTLSDKKTYQYKLGDKWISYDKKKGIEIDKVWDKSDISFRETDNSDAQVVIKINK